MRYTKPMIQDVSNNFDITIQSSELLALLKEVKGFILEQQHDIFIQIEETIKSITNYSVNTPIDTLLAVWEDLRCDQFETNEPLQKILFSFQINIIKHLIDVSIKKSEIVLI